MMDSTKETFIKVNKVVVGSWKYIVESLEI